MTDEAKTKERDRPEIEEKYCSIDLGNGQFLYCPESDLLKIEESATTKMLRQRAREFLAKLSRGDFS